MVYPQAYQQVVKYQSRIALLTDAYNFSIAILVKGYKRKNMIDEIFEIGDKIIFNQWRKPI
jgi:hypothetical protein